MSRHRTILLAAALLAGAALQAQAAVIETDFLGPGDGLLLLDTVNNREWVDVTKTTNMSVNQFLTTSIFAGGGFQLATTADITQFFTAAGATTITSGGGSTYTAGNLPAALLLYNLMEHAPPYTQTGGNPWVHGFEDYGNPTYLTLARFIVNNFLDPPLSTSATFDLGTNGTWRTRDSRSADVGIFAFREANAPIPEPAAWAIWLALAALGTAAGWRRR